MCKVLADDEDTVTCMAVEEVANDSKFAGIFGSDAKALTVASDGVIELVGRVEGDANLSAEGSSDPLLGFELFPGHVVTFGADEAEDVDFAAVFADKGGGQAEATA